MPGVFIVAIVFGGTVLALAIIGSTILMAIKILKGGVSRKAPTVLCFSVADGQSSGQEGQDGLGGLCVQVESTLPV